MKRLLIACGDKEGLMRTYVPAVRLGGWEGALEILAPGDTLSSWEGVIGLLLSGGADIHPKNWDPNEPLHTSASIDEARDSLEIPLARTAWERNLPIFGICRGEQLLNVALGGSLLQDISDICACQPDVHNYGDNKIPALRHTVRVDTSSLLGKTLNSSSVWVNSRHHQAIANVAPLLRSVAWHDETQFKGNPLVEAVEAIDSSRWVLGVQWHPENLVGLEGDGGIAARNLFRAFSARLM
jgi:putative glutamine amidotransferase